MTKQKQFTTKFILQANLLTASLEAMPVQKALEYLVKHPLDTGTYIKFMLSGRYRIPAELLDVLVSASSRPDTYSKIRITLKDLPLLSQDPTIWLEQGMPYPVSYTFGYGVRTAASKLLKSGKFFEVLDATLQLVSRDTLKYIDKQFYAQLGRAFWYIEELKGAKERTCGCNSK